MPPESAKRARRAPSRPGGKAGAPSWRQAVVSGVGLAAGVATVIGTIVAVLTFFDPFGQPTAVVTAWTERTISDAVEYAVSGTSTRVTADHEIRLLARVGSADCTGDAPYCVSEPALVQGDGSWTALLIVDAVVVEAADQSGASLMFAAVVVREPASGAGPGLVAALRAEGPDSEQVLFAGDYVDSASAAPGASAPPGG